MHKLIFTMSIFIYAYNASGEQQLMDFINAGIKSDPILRSSKKLGEASKSEIEAEKSGFYPNINFNSIAAHTYRFDTENNASTLDFSITLTQPLFDKTIDASINTAKSRYELDKLKHKMAKQESIRSIIDDYLSALEFQEVLKNILVQKEFIEEHLQISTKKNQLGRTTSIDVDLVRARQKSIQANLMTAQEEYQTAIQRLTLTTNIQVKEKLSVPNIYLEANDFKDLNSLMLKHPQALILESNVKLSNSLITQEESKKYPRIDAFASLESTQLDLNRKRGSIGLTFDYNLYDGGRINSRTESAILRAESSQILHNNFLKDSITRLKLALSKYQFTQKHKDIAAEAKFAYKKVLDNRKIQFKVGSVSTTEVLQAQEVLFDSSQKLSEITINQTKLAVEILSISGMLSTKKLNKYLIKRP